MRYIAADDIRRELTWDIAIEALIRGHRYPPPQVQDILLSDMPYSLFGRGVILPGVGAGMKVASIFPPNQDRSPPTPVEHAIFVVVDNCSKQIVAVLDGPELTRWKTAADSALGSRLLSREDSKSLLVIGAGPIAAALANAHLAMRPGVQNVLLWNRRPERLAPLQAALSGRGHTTTIVSNLEEAVASADIITSATGAQTPLICGNDIRPGSHVDLVGGFTPTMREADDELISKARVFVDYRPTAVDGSGDLCQPIASGVLTTEDVQGDLYDMAINAPARQSEDITLYKNAGGAHLDLMVAAALLKNMQ
ncbi:ornithine cyclodeaminase family protein [Ruegeria faecimaris]|uniref:Ornithine cyclodeaminase n=1 Tax=Ruegeria faecimaris TaxID=686389 RepID=A0A521EFQ4_9RHOB|nr:NAD(P)-binding domain-containing protein [Ruegeria faecimaris]SMO82757.1 ornithine cyclodeaminase [Ruegeria faecimaris]